MTVYSFREIFESAKTNSPFYRELYKSLSSDAKIEDLPLIESTIFWNSNDPESGQIVTSKQSDGIVFKSGGTSGNAKFSYFSKDEWKTYCEIFGEGMSQGAIEDGDRLANFFYAGDLYASFIFIMKSIEASTSKTLQLPIGGTSEFASVAKVLEEFKVNVWAGPPTTIMKIAEKVAAAKIHAPSKILFGGESFYPDQQAHLISLFPKCTIKSIGYASVDGGFVGYADASCGVGEHRVFSKYSIVEMIDPDTGKVITESGQKGKIYLTNLTRKLMPIIRYPVGDLGEWIEPESHGDRKFRILGRSDEGARVGPTTLYYDDIAAFLQDHQTNLDSSGFQLIIKHFGKLDQLVIRIAVGPNNKLSISELLGHLEKARPVTHELAVQRKMHQVAIEFVKAEQLISNPRTGKLKRIIDQRF